MNVDRAPMRILLSAYACEPYRGSEPGIGWNWALEMQRQGNDLVVLTRANAREKIEAFYATNPAAPKPKFVYYELSDPLLKLFRARILPEQIYYVLWQWFCMAAARKAVQENRSELIWHLTLGSIRLPVFLGRLKMPMVYGPAGGGERAPLAMRQDYTFVGHVMDMLRDALNWLAGYDPAMRATFAASDVILARTPESAKVVPPRWRGKVEIVHEVGVERCAPPREARTPARRIMYAGGFIYLKGITLGVRAFAEFVRLGGVARFTLVGKGPEQIRARKLAQDLKVDHLIDWVSWVEQRDLWRIYDQHDIFLFPSLHDSGGTVVVEALSHGLPVACFDLGGPGQIVTPESGVVQPTAGRTAHEAALELGRALKELVDDEPRFRRLSAGARKRAEEFTWSYRVAEALRKTVGRIESREGHPKLGSTAFERADLSEAGGGHGVGR